MTNETPPLGANLPAWPEQDFSAFGETEQKPLSRIQSLTASFMHRNWLSIPHVTHHDELDITALETFRKALPPPASGARITPLAFQVKALVAALKEFPHFNASLDAAGKTVTLKKYYNVGIAVDTPMGLLVPVLRDCDAKSVAEIATELAAISQKAREKGLSMQEMSGGCMTISSLGHIGGTAFTPIINAPEVAILGVTRAHWVPSRPAAEGAPIEWQLLLPVSLSYDHRVINGTDAARFTRFLAEVLATPEAL